MSIRKHIPQFIKRPLIQLQYVPERTRFRLYRACSLGKFPMPDRLFARWYYKMKSGKHLHLWRPRTLNDKLQWLKLYNRNPYYTKLVDKLELKNIISNLYGEEYTVPTLGIWKDANEINFDKLPEQFILKCSHDSFPCCLINSHYAYKSSTFHAPMFRWVQSKEMPISFTSALPTAASALNGSA